MSKAETEEQREAAKARAKAWREAQAGNRERAPSASCEAECRALREALASEREQSAWLRTELAYAYAAVRDLGVRGVRTPSQAYAEHTYGVRTPSVRQAGTDPALTRTQDPDLFLEISEDQRIYKTRAGVRGVRTPTGEHTYAERTPSVRQVVRERTETAPVGAERRDPDADNIDVCDGETGEVDHDTERYGSEAVDGGSDRDLPEGAGPRAHASLAQVGRDAEAAGRGNRSTDADHTPQPGPHARARAEGERRDGRGAPADQRGSGSNPEPGSRTRVSEGAPVAGRQVGIERRVTQGGDSDPSCSGPERGRDEHRGDAIAQRGQQSSQRGERREGEHPGGDRAGLGPVGGDGSSGVAGARGGATPSVGAGRGDPGRAGGAGAGGGAAQARGGAGCAGAAGPRSDAARALDAVVRASVGVAGIREAAVVSDARALSGQSNGANRLPPVPLSAMIHPGDEITPEEREAAIIGGVDPAHVQEAWETFCCHFPAGTVPRSRWRSWWAEARRRLDAAKYKREQMAAKFGPTPAAVAPPPVTRAPSGETQDETVERWAKEADTPENARAHGARVQELLSGMGGSNGKGSGSVEQGRRRGEQGMGRLGKPEADAASLGRSGETVCRPGERGSRDHVGPEGDTGGTGQADRGAGVQSGQAKGSLGSSVPVDGRGDRVGQETSPVLEGRGQVAMGERASGVRVVTEVRLATEEEMADRRRQQLEAAARWQEAAAQ